MSDDMLSAEEIKTLRTFEKHHDLAAARGLWTSCESLADKGLLHHRGIWEGEYRRYEITPAGSVVAALARTLATLAREGITTGEDGAVRWHGLTGAEIEGMKAKIATGAKWRQCDHCGYLMDEAYWDNHDYNACIECNGESFTPCILIAAAAGRGADGEAGE